ncbi:fimbria/pilus periplasmic chaperone [Pseudomonas promysalinigenes]|uniref:fimbria/pilus periplasmic chaperone n=1 Tax=Pseudomonas promysalinigenes TaxID=485898 RepID=UPI0037C8A431
MSNSGYQRLRRALLPLCLALSLPAAEAALTINATRIIHPSDARSSSVVVANPTKRLFAVQTWVNTQSDDTLTAVPLVPTPVLFRLPRGIDLRVLEARFEVDPSAPLLKLKSRASSQASRGNRHG